MHELSRTATRAVPPREPYRQMSRIAARVPVAEAAPHQLGFAPARPIASLSPYRSSAPPPREPHRRTSRASQIAARAAPPHEPREPHRRTSRTAARAAPPHELHRHTRRRYRAAEHDGTRGRSAGFSPLIRTDGSKPGTPWRRRGVVANAASRRPRTPGAVGGGASGVRGRGLRGGLPFGTVACRRRRSRRRSSPTGPWCGRSPSRRPAALSARPRRAYRRPRRT
jgi:hypothetical protein